MMEGTLTSAIEKYARRTFASLQALLHAFHLASKQSICYHIKEKWAQ